MLSGRPLRLLAALAIVPAAWGAYALRGTPLTSALLALLCVGLVVFLATRSDRSRSDVLHDPAVSTLVFPPESKFEHSIRGPR